MSGVTGVTFPSCYDVPCALDSYSDQRQQMLEGVGQIVTNEAGGIETRKLECRLPSTDCYPEDTWACSTLSSKF